MEIEERLNRLEVNQMLILQHLKEIRYRLPKKEKPEPIKAKVPSADSHNWHDYLFALREWDAISEHYLKIAHVADDVHTLAENAKATEENKAHYMELFKTAEKMIGDYPKFDPLKQGSKLGRWFSKFREKKNVTTPYDITDREPNWRDS